MRVLVIEDSPSEQRLTKARLAKAGWPDVTLCQTLAEAVAVAKQHDVALLDLGLAETSGIESVTAFRDAIPRLPLVVLTADDSDEALAGSIRRGADEYLVKTRLNVDHLRRAVLIAVERHNTSASNQGIASLMRRVGATEEAVLVLFQHPHEKVLQYCVSKGIDADRFHFVDLTQRGTVGLVAPPGVSFIGSPVQLEKASIRIMQACKTMAKPRVIIDSMTTVALYNGQVVAEEFYDAMSRRLNLAGHHLDAGKRSVATV